MHKFTVTAALLFALHIPAAHADWGMGGYLHSLSFDEEKAQEEGVEDSALVLGFIANNFMERMMLSMGVGVVSYDDNEEFQQTVQYTGGFDDGDIENASSTAMGILLHFDAGPRFPIGSSKASYFAVKGGISQMLMSERSISSCTNCYSEDIDIDGGPYVQGALSTGSDRVGFAFQYTQYFDEDNGIANSLGIAISGMF
jgi:hypothetical protein